MASGFSKTAKGMGKCRRRQSRHERQACRGHVRGKGAGHLHERPTATPVCRWWFPHPPREEGAEATQARKPDFHADVGDGIVSRREEVLGGIQARLDPKLVRRHTEDGLELADEMERRDLRLPGELRYGGGGFALFPQEVARQAEASEPFMSQQHVETQCTAAGAARELERPEARTAREARKADERKAREAAKGAEREERGRSATSTPSPSTQPTSSDTSDAAAQ